MRILIFMTQFCRLGGAERLQIELAESLHRRGIHADILSMYRDSDDGVPEATLRLRELGIPAVHFLGMSVHPRPTEVISGIRKLKRLIRSHRYDIVETSLDSPTVLAAWGVRGTVARHVIGIHQVFQSERENSWQHLILRRTLDLNRHVRYYSISDYVSERWIAYSKCPPQHVRRVYNGVSEVWFSAVADRVGMRNDLGISPETRIILYAGRLAAYKGLDILLEAIGPIVEAHNLALVYVGAPDLNVKGTAAMLEQMQARIAHEGWEGRVKFTGFRADVPRLMASADLLAHPTLMEGFGLTLVEALAVGIPVVATSVEAIPEILSGTRSVLVPAEDPEALRQAIVKTLARPSEETLEAIAIGRQRADEFRMEKRTDALMRLFEDIRTNKF